MSSIRRRHIIGWTALAGAALLLGLLAGVWAMRGAGGASRLGDGIGSAPPGGHPDELFVCRHIGCAVHQASSYRVK